MSRHIGETELALFVSGDLNLLRRAEVRLHMNSCEDCRGRVEAYRLDRDRLKQQADEMPPGVDWDRLAAEMTANIRVGLAAGECVAPRVKRRLSFGWQVAAAMGALVLLIGAALWLNFPASDKELLGNAMRQLVRGRSHAPIEETGPVVEASSTGIELHDNGGMLKISQGTLRPVDVSVSAQGSASARYVDVDTGQMTITSVYVQ